MATEFTPEELALYILTLTVQDPDTLPEVEIAREKPLPFKYVSGANKGNRNSKNGRRSNDRRDRTNGRDNYKRVVATIALTKKSVTAKITKTSQYFK